MVGPNSGSLKVNIIGGVVNGRATVRFSKGTHNIF